MTNQAEVGKSTGQAILETTRDASTAIGLGWAVARFVATERLLYSLANPALLLAGGLFLVSK